MTNFDTKKWIRCPKKVFYRIQTDTHFLQQKKQGPNWSNLTSVSPSIFYTTLYPVWAPRYQRETWYINVLEEELHIPVVGFDIYFIISLLVILFVFVFLFVFEHRRLRFWTDIRVHAQFITFEYRLRTYPESGQGWLQKNKMMIWLRYGDVIWYRENNMMIQQRSVKMICGARGAYWTLKGLLRLELSQIKNKMFTILG